jgi:hypothetical protein
MVHHDDAHKTECNNVKHMMQHNGKSELQGAELLFAMFETGEQRERRQ